MRQMLHDQTGAGESRAQFGRNRLAMRPMGTRVEFLQSGRHMAQARQPGEGIGILSDAPDEMMSTTTEKVERRDVVIQ